MTPMTRQRGGVVFGENRGGMGGGRSRVGTVGVVCYARERGSEFRAFLPLT